MKRFLSFLLLSAMMLFTSCETIQIFDCPAVKQKQEKQAALPLYRCLKPLWFTRVDDLREAGDDAQKIRQCLDRVEFYLTEKIDFTRDME